MKRVPSQEDIREVAFKLLGRRELTERELAERLLRKGFTESRITEVLTDLKQLGYIDDRSLCERLVKYLAVEKLQGDRRIESTLRARGVPPAMIGDALANIRKEFSEAEAMAMYFTRKQRGKITAGKLIYHGFPPGLVYETLSRRPNENDGE